MLIIAETGGRGNGTVPKLPRPITAETECYTPSNSWERTLDVRPMVDRRN